MAGEDGGTVSGHQPTSWRVPPTPRWRRALPVALAAALVTVVLARVDWSSFVGRLRTVSYPAFMGFMAVFVVTLLAADVLAARHVYARAVAPVGLRELMVLRGASYLPSLVNHHLGQAWLTYALSRTMGVPLGRVAGATLLVYVSWGGCILALAAVALPAAGLPVGWMALPLGLGVAYLVLLAIKPRRLATMPVVAPLFDAGPGGHLTATLLRLPHAAVLFIGTWIPFLFFGIDIPLAKALVYVPVLMVVVTLPLTPLGFGTRDALAAVFFEGFVIGATSHEARLGAIAAATTTTAVAIMIVDVVLGLALLRPAARLLARTNRPD